MIDLVVQTLWTKPQNLNTNIRQGAYFGFETMDNFLASAYLSFMELKKKGYRIHLYTDNYGKELLIKKLKLNYDYVDLSHETLDLNPNMWAFAKVYTHLKQTEPYIHLDLDAFLFNDFSDAFKSQPIVYQNIEYNFEYYQFLWKTLKPYLKNADMVMHKIRSVMDSGQPYSAMNVGIFGGNDLKTIHTYSRDAIKFMKDNLSAIPNEFQFYLCIFVEQMYCFYYFYLHNIKAVALYNELDKQIEDFINWNDYTHLISGLKLLPENIDRVIKLAEKEGYDS